VRLVQFTHPQTGGAPRVGLLVERGILDPGAAWDTSRGPFPPDPVTLLASHDARTLCRELLRKPSKTIVYHHNEVLLLAPLLRPNSFRDFYAFEEHVRNARGRRGLEVAEEWYRFPVFYFSNHSAIYGPGQGVPIPKSTAELDYELEIGCVIGRAGRDIPVEHAADYIAGFCVLNDWTARDIQREEMRVGLGPAKGKDFATSIGPAIVTPDEISASRSGKGYDLSMEARRNGVPLARGSWKTIHYSFEEMIARASRDAWLYPGDLIGSGTVGTGCILEIGPETAGGWLKEGDRIDLEIDGLGVLTNHLIARP
jgi:fumarylacetoacetate (FAA) hydrolase